MSKYHFITFATPDHMSFAENNARSAINVGKFDTIQIYTMDDIDEEFKLKINIYFNLKEVVVIGYGNHM